MTWGLKVVEEDRLAKGQSSPESQQQPIETQEAIPTPEENVKVEDETVGEMKTDAFE